MCDITRKNLFDIVQEQFPELRENYGEAEGNYHLFGNLAIYLAETLNKGNLSEELLSRIFNLLNRMANHEDPEIQNVLSVGFMEVIMGHEEALPLVRKHLCPNGLRLLDRTISWWTESK